MNEGSNREPSHQQEGAALYHLQNLTVSAERTYVEALHVAEQALGRNASLVGTILGNVGSLANDQGFFAQAKLYYHRALVIHERALGPNAPHVATALDGLARACRGLGQVAEADLFAARATSIRTRQAQGNAEGPSTQGRTAQSAQME